MERINGFIDLNKLLDDKDIKKLKESKTYKYDGDIYFFKYNPYTTPYTELLAAELLKDFKMPCAEYDLVKLDDEYGVASKNMHKDGYKYLNMKTIVENYREYLDEKDLDINREDNSLETIWYALNYRYRNRSNKEEIVSKIMGKIANLFIFDILVSQFDRVGQNFEIMESSYDADLAPIYDNEGMLHLAPGKEYLNLVVDDETNNDLFDELDRFLEISDRLYYNKIIDSLWIIDEENLKAKFRIIEDEKRTNYPIPEEIKTAFLERFEIHRKKLMEKLGLEVNPKENVKSYL